MLDLAIDCATLYLQSLFIGKEITPFILEKVNQLTEGKSLEANQALIENNAKIGASLAVELSSLYSSNEKIVSKSRPVVIGGSNFDVICKLNEALEPNASTLNAKIRTCFGGVGRSLAEAMSRLDCNPLFISAVGNDYLGTYLKHLLCA